MTREDIEKKMHEAAEEIKPLITTLVEALCEAHQKGYLAGVKLGAEMAYPQWISVEEERPKVSGDYIICEKRGFVKEAHYFELDDLWMLPGGALVSPTHWMPLPQHPQGKENKK